MSQEGVKIEKWLLLQRLKVIFAPLCLGGGKALS